jgi:hypothetical protein
MVCVGEDDGGKRGPTMAQYIEYRHKEIFEG